MIWKFYRLISPVPRFLYTGFSKYIYFYSMENALITGATKGMGRAIAIAFAKQGVNLAICSRNADDLASFKTELLQINAGIKVFTAVADGSKKSELLEFAASAEGELGFIGVLINSLGTYKNASILDEKDGDFEAMLN